MRLYTNKLGEWVGTQAEAKKIGASMVEVPTDKPNLLKWLNDFTGHIDTAAKEVVEEWKATTPKYNHPWTTIKECAEKASLKDLGVALNVMICRMDEIAERERSNDND